MFSLDHRSADRDIGRALSGLTGKAREEFVAATPKLRSELVRRRTTSTITVLATGLTSLTGDSARTLVTADGTVRTPEVPKGATKYYRWSLDLSESDGRWLVSSLTLVP
jgi:Mce-associated membrane protein